MLANHIGRVLFRYGVDKPRDVLNTDYSVIAEQMPLLQDGQLSKTDRASAFVSQKFGQGQRHG